MPDRFAHAPTRRLVLAALSVGGPAGASGGPAVRTVRTVRTIRLARPHFRRETTGWYPMQLLQAALSASGAGWGAQVADRMTDARALIELSHPDGQVDAVVGMPNRERMARLRLVPAPLYLGLFGWRALVVRRGEAERWRGLRRVADLQRLRCFQGQDWPDTGILRDNGVPVLVGQKVAEMYERLARGEGDAFPRGLTEAWGDVQTFGPGFEVVPELVLHYRSDLCFFVRPDDVALADALTRGLETLRRTQQLQRSLLREHGADLRQARLAQRHVIELANPELPAALDALPAAWWTPPAP
jgi:hypothetical protein